MMRLYRSNVADLPAPSLTAAKTSLKVTGNIGWYKGGEFGVAYKLTSASTWTYKPQASTAVDYTITGLTASTSYDVCLYVKFNDEIQRGAVATLATTA